MDATETLDLGRGVAGLHGLGTAESSVSGFPWSNVAVSPLRAGSGSSRHTGHGFSSHAYTAEPRGVGGLGASPGSGEKRLIPLSSSGGPPDVTSPVRTGHQHQQQEQEGGASTLSHAHSHGPSSPPPSMGGMPKGQDASRRGGSTGVPRAPGTPGMSTSHSVVHGHSPPTPQQHLSTGLEMGVGGDMGAPASPGGVLQTLGLHTQHVGFHAAGQGSSSSASFGDHTSLSSLRVGQLTPQFPLPKHGLQQQQQGVQVGHLPAGNSAPMMHTLLSEVVDPLVSAALTGYAVHPDALEGISAVCEAMFLRASSLRDAARGGATVPALLLGPILMLHSRLSELLGKQPATTDGASGIRSSTVRGTHATPSDGSTTVVGLTEGLDLGLHLSLTGLPLQSLSSSSHAHKATAFLPGFGLAGLGSPPPVASSSSGTGQTGGADSGLYSGLDSATGLSVSRRMKAGKGKLQTPAWPAPLESHGLAPLTDGLELGLEDTDALAGSHGSGHTSQVPSSKSLSLVHMIALDLVRPGNAAIHMTYKSVAFRADLLPDGTLRDVSTQKVYAQPSGWTLACKRTVDPSISASNGWLDAKVGDGGDTALSLRAVWDKYLATQIAAAAVSVGAGGIGQQAVLGAAGVLQGELTVVGGLQMPHTSGTAQGEGRGQQGDADGGMPEPPGDSTASSSTAAQGAGRRSSPALPAQHSASQREAREGATAVTAIDGRQRGAEPAGEGEEEEEEAVAAQGPYSSIVEMTGVALPDRHRRCKHAGCPQILSFTNYTHEFKDTLPEHLACMAKHGPAACDACAAMNSRLAKRSRKRVSAAAGTGSEDGATGVDLSGLVTSTGPGSGIDVASAGAGAGAGAGSEESGESERNSKRARLEDSLIHTAASSPAASVPAGTGTGTGAVQESAGGTVPPGATLPAARAALLSAGATAQGKDKSASTSDGSVRKCKHLLCPVLVSASNRSHEYLAAHKRHVECFTVHGAAGACSACRVLGDKKRDSAGASSGEAPSTASAASQASVHSSQAQAQAQSASGPRRGRHSSTSSTAARQGAAQGAPASMAERSTSAQAAVPSFLSLLPGGALSLSLAMLPVPDPEQLLAALPLQYGSGTMRPSGALEQGK